VQSVPRPRRYIRGVLQCVAVCCSVLQSVAACCSVLQCVAVVCCSVLQCVAVWATALHSRKGNGAEHVQSMPRQWRYVQGVLQRVAVCCSVLHCSTLQEKVAEQVSNIKRAKHHTATHCNTLQHTATHCNTLQHTATHRNTLQHTATHVSSGTEHAKGRSTKFQGLSYVFLAKEPKIWRCPPTRHFEMLSLCEGCSATPATHCNTLSHTATHCNTLEHGHFQMLPSGAVRDAFSQCFAVCCSVLQCVAVCCRCFPLGLFGVCPHSVF